MGESQAITDFAKRSPPVGAPKLITGGGTKILGVACCLGAVIPLSLIKERGV